MPRNLIHVDSIVDHRGVVASPGALLLEGNFIHAVGLPQELGTPTDAPLTQIDGILTPSFVNVHAHLDLSGVGLATVRNSFIEWVEEVVFPIRRNEDGIELAVEHGIHLAHAGGSAILGDIAGTEVAATIAQESSMQVISFVELLGSVETHNHLQTRLKEWPATYAVEPHAPYSCDLNTYVGSFASGRNVATHLAETPEEIQFAQTRTGPFAEFMKRIGAWNEQEKPWGNHPVDIVLTLANGQPFVAAHLNYIEDSHIAALADSQCTVAYCPRASTYFGHANHRWQEMLQAGVQVALGTDSLLCIDTADRISVIDEMRLLYSRDQADPVDLMKMGTVHGAIGLGVDPSLVTMDEGKVAGMLLFETSGGDPLLEIMNSTNMPTWVIEG